MIFLTGLSLNSDYLKQIGTLILRMDANDYLEKVQLLLSTNPVALQYLEVLGQHYLVIGQAKESSIVFVFTGIKQQ